MMDIDPKAFVDTIERYNRFCEKGQDTDFGKKAEYLKAISKPPFYAFSGQRFVEVSHGGIAVNANSEVLDTNGKVIPGIFAGGDCTTIYGSGNRLGLGGGGSPGGQGGGPGGQSGSPGGPGGAPGGGQGDTGGQGGAPAGQAAATGGAAFAGADIFSGGGFHGGTLGGAMNSGYTGGISAGNYLKNI